MIVIENINRTILSLKSQFSVSAIHDISLRILNEIGIPITFDKALDLLLAIGCKVNGNRTRVFIPEDVIAESLKRVIPQYGLFDRSGEKRIAIGGDNVAFMSGAAAIRVRDFDGTYRPSTLRDLADMTRLQDSLPNLDVMHEIVDALDADPETFRLDMAAEMLKNTTKPCAFVVDKPEEVDDIYNMALAIRGTEKSFRDKPLVTIHDISAEATLGIVRNGCEAMMKCAERGIPTGLAAYPVMGMTGPVTLEGSLALANANVLAALVIVQHINPGNPFLYMIMAGSINMRSAATVSASPEIWQYYVAGQKMAEYYGLPSQCIISGDSKLSDAQLVLEKLPGMLISVLGGINLIHGSFCEMDSMNCASYEQILIDNEMISMIKQLVTDPGSFQGDLNQDAIFNDIRQSLEAPMYFMTSDVTINEYKKRLWNSNLIVRQNFNQWHTAGMKSMADHALQKARDILDHYEVDPLDPVVLREMNEIVKKAHTRSPS
jgi:trimethylamine--corrinoid protein Co-methyltransferase